MNAKLRKFREGEFAYMRVRVIDANALPFNDDRGVLAAVVCVDRAGKPIDEVTHYVPESQLISVEQAVRNVTGGIA